MHISTRLTVLPFVLFVVFSMFFTSIESKNISCYVCNVYTGGAGAMCYEDPLKWWHRSNCDYCMKVYTEQRNLYHRNHPIVTKTTSRICAQKTEALYKYDTCERHIGAATFSVRCWCHTDDCNTAPSFVQLPQNVVLSLFGSILFVTLASL